jgi:NADPH:quinone reductase
MRAMVVQEFGGTPEPAEVPVPAAEPGRIQIHLEAAGVNPYDRKVVDGLLRGKTPFDFPMIPGTDGAGVVTAVGAGVTDFAVGDRVVGKAITAPLGHGTFAEYTAIPADSTVAKLPDAVGSIQAAALPTAGLAAQDLVDAAALVPSQVVLINGASGGVGSFLVQLAAAAEVHVIVTARPDDADRMIRLGADEVVDYTRGPVADQVRASRPEGIDVLFDLISPAPAFAELMPLVRPGGTAYSTTFAADEAALHDHGLKGGNLTSTGAAPELRRLLQRVADGDLVVPIDATRPLADAAQALTATGARGKTVLVI